MSQHSKTKGRKAEHEVVTLLAEAGINAKRQPMSGRFAEMKGDVVLDDGSIVEVKNRETIAEYLWDWASQGGAEYLVIRKNRHPPLVLMSFDKWTELLKRSK